MNLMPTTVSRVPSHTDPRINQEIRQQIEENVACYTASGREAIDQRLKELDQEWDIERMLEFNASAFGLLGLGLAATAGRKWVAFPAIVLGFLGQHAIQGWCPPVSLFRRWGFRTSAEIDCERYALKALRGDFEDLREVEAGSPEDVRPAVSLALEAVKR